MQIHQLRIDTLGKTSLRSYIDDHNAFESLSQLSEALIAVPINIVNGYVMKRLELRAQVLLAFAVQRH